MVEVKGLRQILKDARGGGASQIYIYLETFRITSELLNETKQSHIFLHIEADVSFEQVTDQLRFYKMVLAGSRIIYLVQ